MKKFLFFFVILFVCGLVFSQDSHKTAIGLGLEFNMNSRAEKAAAGGGIIGFDFNLIPSLAAGVTFGASHDFRNTVTLEPAAMFRWYFLNKDNLGLFAQADLGVSLVLDDGLSPKFLGGLRAGMRIPAGANFYVEPFVRGGYPFLIGAGVMAGIRLPVSRSAEREAAAAAEESAAIEEIRELIDEWHDDQIDFIIDENGNMRLRVAIAFRADAADFEGLSPAVIAQNRTSLEHVAQILNRFHHYDVVIEGHSNPTSPPGPERDAEEPELRLISEQRAQRVVQELGRLGVDVRRKTVRGIGSARTIFPWNDTVNNWRNRRVEFILIRRGN